MPTATKAGRRAHAEKAAALGRSLISRSFSAGLPPKVPTGASDERRGPIGRRWPAGPSGTPHVTGDGRGGNGHPPGPHRRFRVAPGTGEALDLRRAQRRVALVFGRAGAPQPAHQSMTMSALLDTRAVDDPDPGRRKGFWPQSRRARAAAIGRRQSGLPPSCRGQERRRAVATFYYNR